jgi:hypothetical protein
MGTIYAASFFICLQFGGRKTKVLIHKIKKVENDKSRMADWCI